MANYRVEVIGQAPIELKPEAFRGGSFFGHDPKIRIGVPSGRELFARLVLTLDNNDPRIAALGVGVGPKVRLVHPLHHGGGDGAVYRHLDGDGVAFTLLSSDGDASWPRQGFPSALPSREIEVVATGEKPRRAFGDASTIFLGGGPPTVGRYDRFVCGGCSTPKPRLVASVPSRPLPELALWDDASVFVLFWFCPACKHITTQSERD